MPIHEMNSQLGLLFLGALATGGCFSDPITASPDGSTSASMSPTSEGESPPGESDTDPAPPSSETDALPPSSDTEADTDTAPPAMTCGGAPDPGACAAASNPDFESCRWEPAITMDPWSCQANAAGGGQCIVEQGLDGCFEPEPSCADGTAWFARVTDGGVELIDATGLCYGLPDFEPCPAFEDTGSTSSGAETGDMTSTGAGDSGATGVGRGSESGVGDEEEQIASACACAC